MIDIWNIYYISAEDAQNAIKLISAAVVGSIIGLERVLAGKDPGLRTFMLVCLGSCLFSVVSQSMGPSEGADPSRIAAQVVPGIGFLGAGAIFRAKDRIAGLTTAAMLWLTASIGMTIGFGNIGMGILTLFITMTFMFILEVIHRIVKRLKPAAYRNRQDLSHL